MPVIICSGVSTGVWCVPAEDHSSSESPFYRTETSEAATTIITIDDAEEEDPVSEVASDKV